MKKIKNFQKILKMHKKCYKSRVKSLKSDKNSLFYDKMPNFKKSTAPELDTNSKCMFVDWIRGYFYIM